jgi:hypothetical protein
VLGTLNLQSRTKLQLNGNGRFAPLQQNRVCRPSGWYQNLNRGDHYLGWQVKEELIQMMASADYDRMKTGIVRF